MLAPWKESYDKPRQHIKKQRHHVATKVHIVKAMVFPVVIYQELDHKKGWVLKNWCFQTVVLEKTLENSLDKEIKPVNPKANQTWTFIRSWSSNTLTPWCKGLAHWKGVWFWESLRVWGERGDRGWDGWMASPSQWTRV